MTVDALLARLDDVRRTGANRWIARCPAHKDRRPSLSIREADAGVVLAYCFAGCTVASIAAAVGLDVADLFPTRRLDVYSVRPRASPITPLVAAFERELLLAHILLADVAAGKPITETDRESAKAAARRVWGALQEARRVL